MASPEQRELNMNVTKQLFETMKEAGLRNYPNESCGLIYKRGTKGIAVECKNIAGDPKHNFLISADDYAQTLCKGEIIGCWHNHCGSDAKPSDADKQGCENTELTWFIGEVHKNGDKLTFGDKIEVLAPTGFMQPLEGRNYCYGTFDCYTLVRDYYKQKFNIDLGEFQREDDPWLTTKNYFADKAEELGFEKINGEPKVGDVFLIQMGNTGDPDHVAIYVGEDRILHQIMGRLSGTAIYGGSYWQEHTISHLRYKGLENAD